MQTQHVLETKQKGNTWLTKTSPNFTALKVVAGKTERLPPRNTPVPEATVPTKGEPAKNTVRTDKARRETSKKKTFQEIR